MAQVELDARTFWSSDFAKSVYRIFAAAKQSAQDVAEGSDDGSTSIEIEGRLGNAEEHRATGRFSPGVTEKFFSKVREFFFKNEKVDMETSKRTPTTETYDVTFRGPSNLRVSVRVRSTGELSVAECIAKQRDSLQPVDANLKGSYYSHDMRVSAMVERKVSPSECRAECTAALRWVHSLLRPHEPFLDEQTRLLSLSAGSPCEIAPGAPRQDIQIIQNSREFEDATGWLQPQIQWTLLAPTDVRDISGARYVHFHDMRPDSEDVPVVIGNLPGLLFTASGASVPLSAFEIVLTIPAKHLTPTQIVAAAPPVPASAAAQLNDVFVRHKRRWTHVFVNVATQLVLDLTETRQGASHGELQASQTKYEMEMERSFSIQAARRMDLIQEVGEFLKCATDVLFMCKVRYEPDALRAAYANLGPSGRLDMGKPAFKRAAAPPPVQLAQDTTTKRPRMDEEEERPARTTMTTTSSNGGDEAENFYNSLSRNREDRHRSRIFHMRAFNNFAKSRLLERHGRVFAREGVRVLELACGKGGDLNKIKKSLGRDLKVYLGTDIAKQSLEEAVQRLGSGGGGPLTSMARFVAADLTECDLSQDDWGRSEGLEMWGQGKWSRTTQITSDRYNLVSMQFALHYMFRARDVVERFFAGVSSRMLPGARFVATTVSADALIAALLASPMERQIVFKDDNEREVCSIEFDEDGHNRLLGKRGGEEDWLGLRYRFRLFDGDSEEDKAVDAPEFVVANPALHSLAERNGLTIVEQCRLGDFALKELRDSQDALNLWRQMRVSNQQGTLSEVEWKIVNLYQVVVFEKRANGGNGSPAVPPPQAAVAIAPQVPSSQPISEDQLYMQVLRQFKVLPEWSGLSSEEKNQKVDREVARLLQGGGQ